MSASGMSHSATVVAPRWFPGFLSEGVEEWMGWGVILACPTLLLPVIFFLPPSDCQLVFSLLINKKSTHATTLVGSSTTVRKSFWLNSETDPRQWCARGISHKWAEVPQLVLMVSKGWKGREFVDIFNGIYENSQIFWVIKWKGIQAHIEIFCFVISRHHLAVLKVNNLSIL